MSANAVARMPCIAAGGAVDGDVVAILQAEAGEVVGVEQDHVAAVDAAVDVVVFVDDGVELAFAADRHQAEFAGGGAVQSGQARARAGAPGRWAWRSAACGTCGRRCGTLPWCGRSRRSSRSRGRWRRSPARICGGVAHRRPIDRRRAIASTPAGDRRDHVDFAAWALVPARAAVAQADVVEHRFLRGRLRLLVAGEHRQDDRLAGQAVGVAGVERRAQVDEQVELRRAPAAANVASGFEP